ncbi:hypothetical protein HRbin02_01915 [Candidatus Calditenuaceae archaeon HR02]|nr:hypothetical protein HRbin02_01915 [Candidatus Calditenuaceae archaeon HR02]
MLGNVTATCGYSLLFNVSRLEEIRMKLNKLSELEKLGLKAILIKITDDDDMLKDCDYPKQYVLNLGEAFIMSTRFTYV